MDVLLPFRDPIAGLADVPDCRYVAFMGTLRDPDVLGLVTGIQTPKLDHAWLRDAMASCVDGKDFPVLQEKEGASTPISILDLAQFPEKMRKIILQDLDWYEEVPDYRAARAFVTRPELADEINAEKVASGESATCVAFIQDVVMYKGQEKLQAMCNGNTWELETFQREKKDSFLRDVVLPLVVDRQQILKQSQA